MPQPQHIGPLNARRDVPEQNNQRALDRHTPPADAFGAVFAAPPDRGGQRGGDRVTAAAAWDLDSTCLTARDRAVVRQLVLLRVLRYDQLQRLGFASVDPSIARRRLRHLARTGWLATWEAPSRHGGHARYAHPTAAAIRTILPTLVPDAPWAPLVARMVPRSQRRALDVESGTPKWLPHQGEINHLLTSIITSPARKVLWASSWDCPLPSRAGLFTLPQPDYVLVEEVGGTPRLVFGEHDRGSEPVERFTARKVDLYSALAAFPEVCVELFGLPSFRVHITVADPVRQSPIARLRALLDAAGAGDQRDIFQFTLGGWLFADAAGPVWFSVACPPTNDMPRQAAHIAVLRPTWNTDVLPSQT